MSIGANIKKRRYELRMSQQELADAMGYKTRSTIAKIESGEIDVSHKKLQRFAEALDITLEELISGFKASSIKLLPELDDSERNRNVCIILAGGKTGRNSQNIPSQFISVKGRPIIVHSMDAYQSHPMIDDIYVVCLKGWENIVKAYAEEYGITKLKGIVPGGASGIASLKNAMVTIKDFYSPDDVIFIQESTRPLVSTETISRLLGACAEKGSGTICHSMNDYVQFDISGGGAKYVERSSIIAMQSPEAHKFSRLREVFAKAAREKHALTESCCTMFLYNLGFEINFIESSINNIKIIREEDLATVGALLKD